MARERRDVLVRMPASLKERLTAEAAARDSSLNDVAVGLLAAAFGAAGLRLLLSGSGRPF